MCISKKSSIKNETEGHSSRMMFAYMTLYIEILEETANILLETSTNTKAGLYIPSHCDIERNSQYIFRNVFLRDTSRITLSKILHQISNCMF